MRGPFLSINNLFNNGFATKETTKYSDNTINILRLIRSENVGIATFNSLIKLYGSAEEAIKHIRELSLKGGRNKPIKLYSKEEAHHELKKLKDIGAKTICYNDEEYPILLKKIPDAPPILTYIGNINLIKKHNIAIVGARNASLNGQLFTKKIATHLGELGFIITSGLARGIDTAAHQAALKTGTIAVIAGGLGNIYPPENFELYQEIAKTGLIIAELPPFTAPSPQHFPQRNRIISGLSIATIVTEAALKSGSLITARLALEQNRELFAVPGFPLDPRCFGTNKLIQDGAHLVNKPEEISEYLSNLPLMDYAMSDNFNQLQFFNNKKNINDSSTDLKEVRRKILENLSSYPSDIDILIQTLQIDLPSFYTALVELELAGKVYRVPGGKIIRNFNELKD